MEKAYPKSINMSLGSDWFSNDLWLYMNLAILVPRTITGNVEMLSGWDALEMATMGGARSLGMADEIGSLEAGKESGYNSYRDLTTVLSPNPRQKLMLQPRL